MSYVQYNGKYTTYLGHMAIQVVPPPPAFPTTGLISRYTFENSIADVWGSNNLSYSSSAPTYTAGKVGNCVIAPYDAKNYYNTLGTYTTNNSPWTLAFWVNNIQPRLDIELCTFSLNSTKDNASEIFIYWSGDTLTVQGTPNIIGFNGFSSLGSSGWHHIVLAFIGAYLLCYLDNNFVGGGVFGTASSSANKFQFPGRSGNYHYMMGYYDQMYFYNKALSMEEIGQLWNNGNGV